MGKHGELCHLQTHYLHKPFDERHRRPFHSVLVEAKSEVEVLGIKQSDFLTDGDGSIQKKAFALIRDKMDKTFYPESRLRQKIARWSLVGVLGHIERRLLNGLHSINALCAPRVWAVVFRTVWNG